MKLIKKNWQKLVFIFYSILIPLTSFAQTNVPAPKCVPGTICNPIKADSIPVLIKTILDSALKIGIPIIALAIIYSGFLFVFARGNSEKLSKAKNALLYTLIGAAILLGSLAIAEMISSTVQAL